MAVAVRFLTTTSFPIIVLFILLMNGQGIAQSQADSLEIYDPFTQRDNIDYILDTYFAPEKVPGAPKIEELIKSLAALQKQGDKIKTAQMLKTIAEAYLRTDNNNLALQYFFRALRMAEEAGDILLRGLLNLRIGAIYPMTESPFETDYTERGIKILDKVNDNAIQAIIAYARARNEANPAKSDSLTSLAINLQREVIKKNPTDTTALENLSKYLNGLSLYDEAIATAERAGSTRLLIIYINNRGMLKYLEKKYSEALPLYLRALKLCKEARMKGLMKNTYHNLSMLYAGLGDFKKSARYLQLHALTRENQLKEHNAKNYIENIVRYEVEAREMRNAFLTLEKDRLEKGLVSARVLEAVLIVGLCILGVMLGIVISGRNKLKKANELLNNQKNEIDINRQQLEFAHRELQESEANLNAAQELAQVANWEWDITEGKFSFSEMMPKLFGFTKEEFSGNIRKSFLAVIHPEDIDRVSKIILEGISIPGEYESSYRILKGEEIRWMLALYKYSVQSNTGSKIISGTVQDITLMKEQEENRIKIEAERMFASELIVQQEAERKRIAFEIHDGIGQDIVAMKNRAELALTDKVPQLASFEYLNDMVHTIPELLQSLRRISQNLHPVHLERMGLTETILQTIRRAELNSTVKFSTSIENIDNLLPDEMELHIFRVVQEILSNILKHSEAKNVVMDLGRNDEKISLIITDDGSGFNIENMKKITGGYGLISIESRARMLGADLSIVSSEKKGTSIQLTIPGIENER